jgi:hypothetical protein
MEREGTKYRVVTLEEGLPEVNKAVIEEFQASQNLVIVPRLTPLDLNGINGYTNGLSGSTRFCWRWMNRENGESYRCVTLEDGSEGDMAGFGSLRPRDFRGINDYEREISDAFFCWRWYKNSNGNDYRTLTIEDDGFCPHKGSSTVTPPLLMGVNGYQDEINQYSFCWRWITREDGQQFRVVTLE